MGLYNNSKLYFHDQLLPILEEQAKPTKRGGKKKKKGKKTKAQLLKDKYGDDIIVKLLLLLLGREKKDKKETEKKKKKGDTAFKGMRRRKGGGGGFATPGQVKKQRDEADKKAKEDRKKAAVAAASIPRPGDDAEDIAERVRKVQIATTDDPVEKALLELTGSMSLPKLEGLQGAIAYLGQFADPLLRPDLTLAQRKRLEEEVLRNITKFRGPDFAKRFAPDPDKGKPTDIKQGVREGSKFVRGVLQTDITGALARGGTPVAGPFAPPTAPASPIGRPPAPAPPAPVLGGGAPPPVARRSTATGRPGELFRGVGGITQTGPDLFSYFTGGPQPEPAPAAEPNITETITDVTQRLETPAERLQREEIERQQEQTRLAFEEGAQLEAATRASLSDFGRIAVGGGTFAEIQARREAERQRVTGIAAEGNRIVAPTIEARDTDEGFSTGTEDDPPPPLGNIGGGGQSPKPPGTSEGDDDEPSPKKDITPLKGKAAKREQKAQQNLEKAIQRVKGLDFSNYPIGKATSKKGTPSRSKAIQDVEEERLQLIKDLEGLASKAPSKINTLITNRVAKLELGQSIIPKQKVKTSVKVGGTQSLFDRTADGLVIRKTGEEEKIGDYFPEWNDLDSKISSRAQQIRDDFEWNMRDEQKGNIKSKSGFTDEKTLIGSNQDKILSAESKFNYTLPSELLEGLGAKRIRRNETIVGMGEKGISILTPKGFLRYITAIPKTTPPPVPPAAATQQPQTEIQQVSGTSETSETGIPAVRSNYRKNKKFVRDLIKKQSEGKTLTTLESKRLQDTLREIRDYKTEQTALGAAPDLGDGGDTETSGYYTQDSDTGQEIGIRFKDEGAVERRAQRKFPGEPFKQQFYNLERIQLREAGSKIKGQGARKKELAAELEQRLEDVYQEEISGGSFLVSDSVLMTSEQKQKAQQGDFAQRQTEVGAYSKIGTETERGISGYDKIVSSVAGEATRIRAAQGQEASDQYMKKQQEIISILIKKQIKPKLVAKFRAEGQSKKEAQTSYKQFFESKDNSTIVREGKNIFRDLGETLAVGTPQYKKFQQAYNKEVKKVFGKTVSFSEETQEEQEQQEIDEVKAQVAALTGPKKENTIDKLAADISKIDDKKKRETRRVMLGGAVRKAIIDRERKKPNPDESLISDLEFTPKTQFLDYESYGISTDDATKGSKFSKKVAQAYRLEIAEKEGKPPPPDFDPPSSGSETEQPPGIDEGIGFDYAVEGDAVEGDDEDFGGYNFG